MKRSLVICIDNEGYEASLETRKIYEALPDEVAEPKGLIRVIDESDEDYLYPKEMFMEIDVPKAVRESLQIA